MTKLSEPKASEVEAKETGVMTRRSSRIKERLSLFITRASPDTTRVGSAGFLFSKSAVEECIGHGEERHIRAVPGGFLASS